jgi:hypothetical protein
MFRSIRARIIAAAVDDRHRVGGGFIGADQHTAQRCGTARNAQLARQHAFSRDAALNTV